MFSISVSGCPPRRRFAHVSIVCHPINKSVKTRMKRKGEATHPNREKRKYSIHQPKPPTGRKRLRCVFSDFEKDGVGAKAWCDDEHGLVVGAE